MTICALRGHLILFIKNNINCYITFYAISYIQSGTLERECLIDYRLGPFTWALGKFGACPLIFPT